MLACIRIVCSSPDNEQEAVQSWQVGPALSCHSKRVAGFSQESNEAGRPPMLQGTTIAVPTQPPHHAVFSCLPGDHCDGVRTQFSVLCVQTMKRLVPAIFFSPGQSCLEPASLSSLARLAGLWGSVHTDSLCTSALMQGCEET